MVFVLENVWNWIWQACHPQRWTGPLLGKELRVASRQRKYYLLRLAYVGLLVAVIYHFWHLIVQVGAGASGVGQVARLGVTGVRVVVTIVWFQFLSAQILAIVLLSDAISSEIRQGTLEGLLVTPTGAVQIVLGKFFGRLLHVVLFLAISVPVLGVARAFGGVPWDYVISGLCITLSAMFLAGSLSLYYSICHRQTLLVFLEVGGWYLGWCSWDIFSLWVWTRSDGGKTLLASSLVSPFSALMARTETLLAGPTGGSALGDMVWACHCPIILTLAVVVLARAVRQMRRVGRNPTLLLDGATRSHATGRSSDAWRTVRQMLALRKIRRVEGPPIVWKELKAPLFRRLEQALLAALGVLAVIGGLVIILIPVGSIVGDIFSLLLWITRWVFILHLGVDAARAVTREKEARTWAVLLTTPLSNAEIIWGKARAVLRKNLPLFIVPRWE